MVRLRFTFVVEKVAALHETEHGTRSAVLARTDMDQHQLFGDKGVKALLDDRGTISRKIAYDLRGIEKERHR